MRPGRRTGWPAAALLAALAAVAAVAAVACTKPAPAGAGIALTWTPDPAPPRIGPTTIRFGLQDTVAQAPVAGAVVHVEGIMSHPGMAPSLADAEEVAPGRYEAHLQFTMAGDWYLLFDIRLADGRRLQRQVDVPGVRQAG